MNFNCTSTEQLSPATRNHSHHIQLRDANMLGFTLVVPCQRFSIESLVALTCRSCIVLLVWGFKPIQYSMTQH